MLRPCPPRKHIALRAGSLALLCGAALAATDAAAGPPPDQATRIKAARLFQEAKTALAAGKTSEACPKFEESYKLDPGIGGLLALAVCHEGENKTATAFREFNEVVAVSEASGRNDRVAIAKERIRELEPKLSSITIEVPPANRTERLEVTLDREVLAPARWSKPIVLDPGPHVLEAHDGTRRPWRLAITVGTADRKTFEIPRLEADDGTTKDPILDQPASSSSDGTRTLGLAIGGVGIVALGVGAYFGLSALSDRKRATELCAGSACPDAHGVELNDRAYTEAWISNITIGVGIVGVAVGTYLAFIRPRGGTPSAQVRAPHVTGAGPWLARGSGGGLGVTGAF